MTIVSGSLVVDSLVNGQQYTIKSNTPTNVYTSPGGVFLFSVNHIGTLFTSDGSDIELTTPGVATVSIEAGDVRTLDSFSGETVFSRVVDDELIDWANNVNVDLLTLAPGAKRVEVEVRNKSGQSGGNQWISSRFNNNVGSVYSYVQTNTTEPSSVSGDASTGTGMLVTLSNGKASSTFIDLPVKSKGTKIAYNQRMNYIDNVDAMWVRNRACMFEDDVNDITSIQIYTGASTNVSCEIIVRAWS